MDGRTTAGGEAATSRPSTSQPRRKKRGEEDSSARFFLPREGSLPNSPELGPEMTSEGEALIRSLKADQVYFAVTTWKAVAEENGGSPVIVKQAFGG